MNLRLGDVAPDFVADTTEWKLLTRSIAAPEPGPEIVAIDTPTLGDRSYLVHDGRVAFVIDPQRDIDRVLDVAAGRGVRVTHVFETHVHNDYVTGGPALARATGAAYHVNAADEVAFARVPVRDGDVIDVSPAMRIRVIATPGHTFTHVSYALEAAGRPRAVFSGGSLLYGSTGRPDLLGAAHATELAHAQYASAHRLAAVLPEDADVYPTHGFGSFCAATQSAGASSTIGRERRVNPALTLDEQRYVSELLSGLDVYPAYYAHMHPANAAGPADPDLSTPHRADADELRRRIEAGEWVVDLRARRAFAAGHMAGTLGFDLDGSFATYLGWLIPWGTPLTLLGQTPEQVAEAQRELARIGVDRPAAMAVGDPAEWSGGRALRSFGVGGFADLAAVRRHRPVVILDVRRDLEWAESHIDDAIHIPLHELPGRLAEVPEGELWVHCRSGYRASVAASLLEAAGRTVVAIDDDYDHASPAGLPVTTFLGRRENLPTPDDLPGSAGVLASICGFTDMAATGICREAWAVALTRPINLASLTCLIQRPLSAVDSGFAVVWWRSGTTDPPPSPDPPQSFPAGRPRAPQGT